MLETLAGPVTVAEGLADRAAVAATRAARRRGRRCSPAARRTRSPGAPTPGRRHRPGGDVGARCARPSERAPARGLARRLRPRARRARRRRMLAVPFNAPAGPTVLLATWAELRRQRRGDGADRGRRTLAAPGARARGGRARPPGGGRPAPLARAPARLPVAAQPRAAHAADGDPRLRVEPDAARRDLGRRVRSSASWTGSPPSRRGWAGWSTTCSTSRRSSPG